ncbi:DUF4304 domain-containing protein [Singulisphaera rosea]
MGIRAKDIIVDAIGRAVVPLLKDAGFRKTGLRFQRAMGGIVQVIDFQLSQSNFADTGRFYVNVALGFDLLWGLEAKPRPVRPKPHECQVSKRMEELVAGTPDRWDVSASTEIDKLAERLSVSISTLLIDLNGITSIGSLLGKGWQEIGADLITRSRLHYVTGDYEAALADLRRASEFFSDRRGMSLRELIRRNGMSELAGRIGDAG